ncbi:MAG TPA: hypothetical protein VG408_10030 [Actinomycetota bacterium]|nr:hypothetical protein [Actinomycetota bacterium]
MLVATLVATGIVAASPSPAQACRKMTRTYVFDQMRAGTLGTESSDSGSLETVTLRTFNLDVTAPKVAEIGTTVTIKVLVTRPAKEDPLGQGIPMDRPFVEPAPEVIVGVGLSVGNVFLPGAAMTDEDGLAKVKITIQDYAPANKTVNMSVYAWKVAQQTPCLTVQEDGYKVVPDAFRTTD